MCNRHRMDYLCECSGGCDEEISLTLAEVTAIFQGPDWDNLWIIADHCPHGPEPDYILVEKREGYSLYKEKEADNESH